MKLTLHFDKQNFYELIPGFIRLVTLRGKV